ncbi:protocadherin gamma-B4-like [Babylonia areolata]|uniref:protocadherin gamma-B4-like n=1 Tax=Babylonia areolata TaxID=304850 RepID=UPI003FD5D004
MHDWSPDGNKAPYLLGLNTVMDVPEDAEDGSSLVTWTVHEGGDNPFCLLAADPPEALQYYHLEMSGTSGDIKLKMRLNYEQTETRFTNLTVTCSDGFCASLVGYLYVMVTDVNEPLTLLPADVTLTVYEGSISVDPNWTPLDEDVGDDLTFTIVSGNIYGRFDIEPTTGVITSTVTYDIDDFAMPSLDMIVVEAQDEGGHVSTSTVTLTVVDLNDHRPVFSEVSVTLRADNCTYTVGTVIGNLTATDMDSSYEGNNVIVYSGTDGFITVDSDGNIYVDSVLTAGASHVVEAWATDSGQQPGPLTSAKPATVIVEVVVGSKENWFWIAMSSLLAMVLFTAVGAVVWKFSSPVRTAGGTVSLCSKEMCGDCCEPNAPKNGNSGFWQERYTDDDYLGKQPSRNLTPSPAPVEGGGPLFAESWRSRAICD